MSIYMQFQRIEGDVSAKGYEDWIALDSLTFGVRRDIRTRIGNTHDREAAMPTMGEVIVGFEMNKASPNLFIDACVGKSNKQIKIHICQTGVDQTKPYVEYILSNVLISSYHMVVSTSAKYPVPRETINLNFDKIEMKYIPYDRAHNPSSPIPSGYCVTTGTKV